MMKHSLLPILFILFAAVPSQALSIKYVPTSLSGIHIQLPTSSLPPKPNEIRIVKVPADEGVIRFHCHFSDKGKLDDIDIYYQNDDFFIKNRGNSNFHKGITASDLRFDFTWSRTGTNRDTLKPFRWEISPAAPIVVKLRKNFTEPTNALPDYRLVSEAEDLQAYGYGIGQYSSEVHSWHGNEAGYLLKGDRGEKILIILTRY